MSDKEKSEWLSSFGNKIIGIVAAGVLGALWITFMFMNSIESTMQHTNENVNLKFMMVDKKFDAIDTKFDKVDNRFDKVEDKVDGIYHNSVPKEEQDLEPRKKKPNF